MLSAQLLRNATVFALLLVVGVHHANGQLQIVEIMYNSVNEGSWEWVEVRNLTAAGVNLDGFVFDDNDGVALGSSNIVHIGSGGMAANTTIPAGGVGVLYNGTALSFTDQRFRNAWQLNSSVPLIAVQGAPELSNSGDAIGLWSSVANYNLDIADADMDGDFEVVQFTNSLSNVDFTSGFPSATDASIYWNGAGIYNQGANWLRSMDGTDGAVTSVPTMITTTLNSTQDLGNPGALPVGTVPAGISITEIMYNPDSAEPSWEWFEVVNNTGSTIDFGVTPYTFDDASPGVVPAENITAGLIPQGGTAVMYNAESRSLQDLQDAWGAAVNFIPVSDWTAGLNNSGSGDTVALWDNYADYVADQNGGNYSNAAAVVSYSINTNGWPASVNGPSIHLSPVDADPTQGTSWRTSDVSDLISFHANAVVGQQVDHAGGDVGSPGFFGSIPLVDGDFNDDGLYDCLDINPLIGDIATGSNSAMFDLTGDGLVDLLDRDAWLSEAGLNNLPSQNPYLLGDANLDGVVDGSDFGRWNANKFTAIAEWCSGDFNADGVVDGSDFGIWNAGKFTSADGAANVPEPSIGWLLAVAGLLLTRRGTPRSVGI